MAVKCRSLRESLTEYLAQATAVQEVGDMCVATLPVPTVDGRLVDVVVESRMNDYCLVHDGGKAVNELILQGVNVTDSLTEFFKALAKRFQVSYDDEAFNATGKIADAQAMILSVGTCSSLAMAQLIGNISAATEAPLREQFGRAVRAWAKRRYKVAEDITVPGPHFQHRFDFVAYPRKPRNRTLAMSVLLPGSNSLAAAERFGFKSTDLESTVYGKWGKIALQGRSEAWSAEAKALLRRCADVVIELPGESTVDIKDIAQKLEVAAA
jgi:hypothetical protein